MAKHKEVDAGKQVLPAEVRAKEEKAIKALEEKIATLDEWFESRRTKSATRVSQEKPPLVLRPANWFNFGGPDPFGFEARGGRDAGRRNRRATKKPDGGGPQRRLEKAAK
ncbi:MAG: hypothetical protein IPN90_08205 [Elusimicrobia bacterium]|nr:hypothetical protein [Elusimicrobiota bacterium]